MKRTQQTQYNLEKEEWADRGNAGLFTQIGSDNKVAYGGVDDGSANQNVSIYNAAFTAANRPIPSNNEEGSADPVTLNS